MIRAVLHMKFLPAHYVFARLPFLVPLPSLQKASLYADILMAHHAISPPQQASAETGSCLRTSLSRKQTLGLEKFCTRLQRISAYVAFQQVCGY